MNTRFPDRLRGDRDIVARFVCIFTSPERHPITPKESAYLAPSVPAPIVKAPL
jgi:hypothetical protein